MDEGVIISASIGGVILLLMPVTLVLCIVMLCMKSPYKRKKSPSFVKASFSTTKLRNSIATEHDASYNNIIEVISSTIKREDLADVPITINPSYGIPIKPYYNSKPSEDEYSYVQPDEFNQCSDLDVSIKMHANPSYGVCILGDGSAAFNASVIEACQSLHVDDDAAITEYDYAYAHNNHLLCQNIENNTSAASDEKEESHTNVDQSDQNYLPLIF